MSIDRFIIKKLDSCHEEQTRQNLVSLLSFEYRRLKKQKKIRTIRLAEIDLYL